MELQLFLCLLETFIYFELRLEIVLYVEDVVNLLVPLLTVLQPIRLSIG